MNGSSLLVKLGQLTWRRDIEQIVFKQIQILSCLFMTGQGRNLIFVSRIMDYYNRLI